jgi:hypothetical protein
MPRKLSVRVRTLPHSSGGSEEDEDGSGSETLDTGAGATESDEDEGQSSGQGAGEAPGGFTSVEVDSGLLTRERMVEKTRRRGHRNSEAKDMDALLTEKAREEGRLQARSLSEVTDRAQDGVLLQEGEKFMCRQEVLLRIRDHAIALIHDETGLGASRIPGIQAAFARKGYWFRVHFADQAQMVHLTAMGMKAQHDANEAMLVISARIGSASCTPRTLLAAPTAVLAQPALAQARAATVTTHSQNTLAQPHARRHALTLRHGQPANVTEAL